MRRAITGKVKYWEPSYQFPDLYIQTYQELILWSLHFGNN